MNALFDRDLLRLRRAHAAACPEAAGYLLSRMAGDIAERLMAVNRAFPVALAIGGGDCFPKALVAAGSAAKIRTLITADLEFTAAAASRGRAEHHGQRHPPSAWEGTQEGGALSLAIVCDDERLPVAPVCLDLIASIGVLQWANDLPGALFQARCALKPDGLFLATLVGGTSLQELRQAFLEAEAELEGGASPHVAPMVDVRDLGHLLQRAGFALPVTDIDRVEITFDTPFALLRDLRAMGATNILHARRRVPLRRATLLRAMEIYEQRFHDHEGRVRATFEILHASGWAPHASQPRPLRPGTAARSLADALENIGKAGPREV